MTNLILLETQLITLIFAITALYLKSRVFLPRFLTDILKFRFPAELNVQLQLPQEYKVSALQVAIYIHKMYMCS